MIGHKIKQPHSKAFESCLSVQWHSQRLLRLSFNSIAIQSPEGNGAGDVIPSEEGIPPIVTSLASKKSKKGLYYKPYFM